MTIRISSTPAEVLLRKGKALRRELLARQSSLVVRIAFLGGSTTTEVTELLELLLLEGGIQPEFYQSDYNRYFEEAVIDSSRLSEFHPEIAIIYTSSANIQGFPPLNASEFDFSACIEAEVMRFTSIWNALDDRTCCIAIQNNFELPPHRLLGNLDCVNPGGFSRFVGSLNQEFSRAANARPKLLINDLNSIAATLGLNHFHDARRWFSYKIVSTPQGSLALARSLAAIISSIRGRSRKCLVLDLDNTLWGGVIGDDGPEHIKIGRETAEAEAFSAFQQYCLRLRERGIVLAVCSKNSEHIATRGFEHPDSVLRGHHFSCFKANWKPKDENIKAIAAELNLGLESLVFVDDNPAERAIVQAQLPMVAVPDIGSDVTNFIRVLEEGRYFEPAFLSSEDLDRARHYDENARRTREQVQFANYSEYLESLDMTAEIDAFRSIYLERITQLINKTNQFNLTTKRYTFAEVQKIATDSSHIALYGKLTDKFGDNGLVSVIIGRRDGHSLHLELWIMSCRVLKRDMELAMFDALVAASLERGITELFGYYIPTDRNALVSDHYEKLGFQRQADDLGGKSVWKFGLSPAHVNLNRHIKEPARG